MPHLDVVMFGIILGVVVVNANRILKWMVYAVQGFIQGGGGGGGGGRPGISPPPARISPPKFENCYVIIAYTWSKTAVER